jgi:hypothetical protein
MLTHNSIGARIGNNVTVSSTSVYLMHLPNDVLSSIPTSVTNSGLGGAPNFFDPLDVISDIANMVFDFLVWVATGGLLLLWAHLMILGLEAIGNLLSAAAAAVLDVINVIWDAFNEYINWVISLAKSVLKSEIPESVDVDNNSGEFRCIASEISDNGTTALNGTPEIEGKKIANNLANTDLFKLLLAVCIVLFGAITIIAAFTITCTWLVTIIIIPFAISMIIPCVLDAMDVNIFDLAESTTESVINQILGEPLATSVLFVITLAMAVIDALAGFVDTVLSKLAGNINGFTVVGLILYVVGLVFTVISFTEANLLGAIVDSIIGLIFSLIGFTLVYMDRDSPSGIANEITGARDYLLTWSVLDCGFSLIGLEMAVNAYDA